MDKTKILIVDDHRVVIEGIKSALQEHPEFEVVGEAVDGIQALELAKSLGPDIVIMDISMPNLSGIEATRQIKEFDPEIRIVIFSMYSDKEFVIDLFKAGISAYVLKDDPFSRSDSCFRSSKRWRNLFQYNGPHGSNQAYGRTGRKNGEYGFL